MIILYIYLLFSFFLWADLLINRKKEVGWITSLYIALGWPIWIIGASRVLHNEVSVITKEEDLKNESLSQSCSTGSTGTNDQWRIEKTGSDESRSL